MNHSFVAIITVLSVMALVMGPAIASASAPTLTPPPATLPPVTYYTNPNEGTHYTISTPEWNSFLADIIDNRSYVTHNFTLDVYQPLILFDLSYSGLNYYGAQFVSALSHIGFPSVQNMSLAFNQTKNLQSQIKGYTNIQALDAGAYPAFSWSLPVVHSTSTEYEEIGSIVALVGVIFVLYFIFNRKK
ncbi:MAG: hypothetical protein QW597_02385 [Thermoplasmataceae archaeon]